MGLITSDCGTTRYLGIKWPVSPRAVCFLQDHDQTFAMNVMSYLLLSGPNSPMYKALIEPNLATVILLYPPLPLAGVSIVMERGCQQNDSLVNG